MIAEVRMEDHQIVMVAEATMDQAIVVVRMEDNQMDEVEDQQREEHQMADLLRTGVAVLQEIQMEDHHLPGRLIAEVAIKTGPKVHQQEKAIARHQQMEEELVVKKVALLQAAGEIQVNAAKREIELRLYFSYLSNLKILIWQSIQKKLAKKLKKLCVKRKEGP